MIVSSKRKKLRYIIPIWAFILITAGIWLSAHAGEMNGSSCIITGAFIILGFVIEESYWKIKVEK